MSASTPTASQDALIERLFVATIAAMDLFSVYLCDRLGYYTSLANDGPATSLDLAQRTGTDEPYPREWLAQEAVTGFLTVENQDAEATDRRFRLPDGYNAIFADPDSLTAMAPMAQIF